jgi:uncharacterized protein YqeY
MSLKDQINTDIKEAMKAKENAKRDALRLLSSAFKQIEVDERKELTDDDVIKIIQKQIKQKNDSITQYQSAGRDDLIEKEMSEIAFYEPYLPKQLSDEELTTAIKAIVTQVEATSMKDIGKVMGMASKELAGKVDGKRINECAKALLS